MKKFILCFYIILSVEATWAQSYHFSQFFSTPLLTNPANTGFTDGLYRVASNFRSQGNLGGNNFFTGYVSADLSPFRNRIPDGHKAGLGVYVMNDQSLTGAMQSSSIGLSAAYHVGLDIYGERSIGAGVQGTYHQRRIDYSKLKFESQFGPGGYDAALPIGESINFDSRHFFDVNAGIVYNINLQDKAFFAGIAVYNLLGHQENILEEEFKMPRRFTLQAGSQFYLGEYGKVYSSITAMTQANANEITVGGAYGHQMTDGEKNEMIGGIWYRHNDALIPYIGYHYKGFQVGFSYDYTVSSMKTAAEISNGYELTLLFKAPDKRELKTLIPWY